MTVPTRQALAAAAMAMFLPLSAIAQSTAETGVAEATPVRNVMSAGQPADYEVVAYHGEDIELVVPPEEQSVLRFPWDVMPANSLNEMRKVDLLNLGDTVRFTPLMPLEKTRWVFRDKNSRAIITATIRTEEGVPPARLDFVDARPGNGVVPAPRAPSPDGQAAAPVTARGPDDQGEAYDIAKVNQFALQQVYAVERLKGSLPGISRTRVDRSARLRTLFIGEDVLARPVEGWQTSNGLYVTRLVLENADSREVHLDGEWVRYTRTPRTTLFASTRLGPRGSDTAKTTMIVVSEMPWASVTEGVL